MELYIVRAYGGKFVPLQPLSPKGLVGDREQTQVSAMSNH